MEALTLQIPDNSPAKIQPKMTSTPIKSPRQHAATLEKSDSLISETINKMLSPKNAVAQARVQNIGTSADCSTGGGRVQNTSEASRFQKSLKAEMSSMQDKLKTDFAKEISNIEASVSI